MTTLFGTENRDTAVALNPETWGDLGNPGEITVAIQPGDHLND